MGTKTRAGKVLALDATNDQPKRIEERDAQDLILSLGFNAIKDPKAAQLCEVLKRLLLAFLQEVDNERHYRWRGGPRLWLDRGTQLELFPSRDAQDPSGHRESYVTLGHAVTLSKPRRAELRDAVREVSRILLGNPVKGHRSHVFIEKRSATPTLRHPLGIGAEADALWESLCRVPVGSRKRSATRSRRRAAS